MLGGVVWLEPPPKNRYKHVRVRFSPAIHGLRNFLAGPATNARVAFRYINRCSGWLWLPPPKNVRSQGWRSPSAHGCACSVFWEGATTATLPNRQQATTEKNHPTQTSRRISGGMGKLGMPGRSPRPLRNCRNWNTYASTWAMAMYRPSGISPPTSVL